MPIICNRAADAAESGPYETAEDVARALLQRFSEGGCTASSRIAAYLTLVQDRDLVDQALHLLAQRGEVDLVMLNQHEPAFRFHRR